MKSVEVNIFYKVTLYKDLSVSFEGKTVFIKSNPKTCLRKKIIYHELWDKISGKKLERNCKDVVEKVL